MPTLIPSVNPDSKDADAALGRAQASIESVLHFAPLIVEFYMFGKAGDVLVQEHVAAEVGRPRACSARAEVHAIASRVAQGEVRPRRHPRRF